MRYRLRLPLPSLRYLVAGVVGAFASSIASLLFVVPIVLFQIPPNGVLFIVIYASTMLAWYLAAAWVYRRLGEK